MEKQVEKKKLSGKTLALIIGGAALLVAALAFVIVHFAGKKDSYRSIQIYELEGTATIEREKVGDMDAVENLYLQSGDRITVDKDSTMRLKVDDDKYIMVEAESVLSIVATGTKENSKTSIELEQGAITNEIQNKLSEKSSYNVTTPNSVMAVRGTIFRVEVTVDEEGEVYTRVSTFEGKVGSSLVLPDGTKVEEIVLVEGGKEVIIHMDNEITEYLTEPQDINYEMLPVETLEYLVELVENGTDIVGISLEELETMIDEKKEDIEEEDSEDDNGENVTEDAIEKTTEPTTKASTETTTKASTETTTKASTETTTKASTKNYTVTFMYNGAIFGTQSVEDGQTATAPKLAPAGSGGWDFDFSKPITEDTAIEWK